MNEVDKRTHLAFFVLFFMNLFYALINNSYLYLVYFVFALIISYFMIYPDKFFLIVDDTKKFGQRIIHRGKRYVGNDIDMGKSYKGNDIPDEMDLDTEDDKRHEKEGISSEDTENIRKGSNNSCYY